MGGGLIYGPPGNLIIYYDTALYYDMCRRSTVLHVHCIYLVCLGLAAGLCMDNTVLSCRLYGTAL